MKGKDSILIYWILLLVPTVIIGAAAFRLLLHEQERINRAAVSSASDRADAIAETIRITIEEVEEELTQSLFQIPEERLKKTLLTWEENNPLIRNVFIWSREAKLVYPLASMESTSEERRFITRYDALFSGRIPWQHQNNLSSDMGQTQGTPSPMPKESQTRLPKKTARRGLLDLARGKVTERGYIQSESVSPQPEPILRKDGWIPWFAENRLHILGWVQQGTGKPVYGVELELMTLLSRIVTDFPVIRAKDMVYALVDGTGLILHQSGGSQVDADASPQITVPLSNSLPHWQIAVYLTGSGTPQPGRSFLYLSGLLLAIFIAAILSGGSLLTLQAHRNMKDAMEKTSFVSSVSHELKTPLTSIRMYAELLQAGRVKAPEKQNHYLSVIVAESQRLTRLVNNVLDFGLLEQGKKSYHREEFDLAGYLNTITEAQRLRISESGLELHNRLPKNHRPVKTDRDAVEQVLLNLIDNAIKYAADGKEISIRLESDENGFYLLKICDKGPGIPPSHRKEIFEKFHRVDNSLTSGKPGSGLGLSIARRILRDLGGDLVYEPAPQKGSCFIAKINNKNNASGSLLFQKKVR